MTHRVTHEWKTHRQLIRGCHVVPLSAVPVALLHSDSPVALEATEAVVTVEAVAAGAHSRTLSRSPSSTSTRSS